MFLQLVQNRGNAFKLLLVGCVFLSSCQQVRPPLSFASTPTVTAFPTATFTQVTLPDNTATPTQVSTPTLRPSPTVTPIVMPTFPPPTPPPTPASASEALVSSGIWGVFISPPIAELMLTDSQGRRIGYDPVAKETINDFSSKNSKATPGVGNLPKFVQSTYTHEPQAGKNRILLIPPPVGEVTITITGIETGDYELSSDLGDQLGAVNVFYLSDTINAGQIETVSFEIPDSSSEVPYPPEVRAGPDISAKVNQSITFASSIIDLNPNDTHQITWDFGDGNELSDTLTPSHRYSRPTVYTVTLTVVDSSGLALSDTLRVTVE